MKLVVFLISALFFASANSQQSSLELFNEQQKKENLKKQFERDKEALGAQKQKDLASQIIAKGLLVMCSSDKEYLINKQSTGYAYFRGKRYLWKFYRSQFSSCERDNECVAANGGYYAIHMHELAINRYIVRSDGNQLLVIGPGYTEDEVYIKESVSVETKNMNSRPERKKYECLIMNKESAEYK